MASINKIQLPDGITYDINDVRIPADENPATKEWIEEQGFGSGNSLNIIELEGQADENNRPLESTGTLTDEQFQLLQDNYYNTIVKMVFPIESDTANAIFILSPLQEIAISAAENVFWAFGFVSATEGEIISALLEIQADKSWTFTFEENDRGGESESSPTIIDVATLPTENIQSNAFYRRYSCLYYYGYTLQEDDKSLEKYMNCSVVSRLEDVTSPEKAMPMDDLSQLVTYYDISRQNAFGFSTYELDATAVLTTIDGYWYPVEAFFAKLNLPYAGIITELPSAIEQAINVVENEEKQYYLLVQSLLFSHVGDTWQLMNNYLIYLPFSQYVDGHASTWTVPNIWQEMITNYFTNILFYTNNKWIDFGEGHNNFIPVECYNRYSYPVFTDNESITHITYYFKGDYIQDLPRQSRTYVATIEGILNNGTWTLTTSDTEASGGTRSIILYSTEGTLVTDDISAIQNAAQIGSVNSVLALYNNKILTFSTFSLDPDNNLMVSISFDEAESYILIINSSSGAYTVTQSPFTPGKLTGTSGQLEESEANNLLSKVMYGSGVIVAIDETTNLLFLSFAMTDETTATSSATVNGKDYTLTISLATLTWSIVESGTFQLEGMSGTLSVTDFNSLMASLVNRKGVAVIGVEPEEQGGETYSSSLFFSSVVLQNHVDFMHLTGSIIHKEKLYTLLIDLVHLAWTVTITELPSEDTIDTSTLVKLNEDNTFEGDNTFTGGVVLQKGITYNFTDSNGEPGRVYIDTDNIELILGDQAAGILIDQYNGNYNTTIWGNINLSGPVNTTNLFLGSTGFIEHDGESVSIGDSVNLYLCSDGDNGTSSIDMYNTEIKYHSTTHKFTGDITAQRSGETTASKVITAADFTYANNVLTIKLS